MRIVSRSHGSLALLLLASSLLNGCEAPAPSSAVIGCLGLTGSYQSGVDTVVIAARPGPASVFCVVTASRCQAQYTFRTDQPYTDPMTVSVSQSGMVGTVYSPECTTVSASTTASCEFIASHTDLVMNCGTAPRSFVRTQ